MACTEKTKFVDGKEIYGKTFNQSEISSVARFLNLRNDQILLETVKLVEFLVVNYWRFFHRRPPANVPRLGQPGLAPPIYLPPHFPLKNKTRKVYYFTKVCCCSLPIFSLISSSSNGYSCYIKSFPSIL